MANSDIQLAAEKKQKIEPQLLRRRISNPEGNKKGQSGFVPINTFNDSLNPHLIFQIQVSVLNEKLSLAPSCTCKLEPNHNF